MIKILILQVLLDLAKHYAPSVIFIDEIDWTAIGSDDSSASKSEPSRRFRAELLARLDGLLTMENANILLLAATNIPWYKFKTLKIEYLIFNLHKFPGFWTQPSFEDWRNTFMWVFQMKKLVRKF